MLHATQLSNHVRWSGVCPFTISTSASSLHLYIRLNYTWINQDRKSINLTAPTYIDYVMTWVQNLLDDGKTFPTISGTLFVNANIGKWSSNSLQGVISQRISPPWSSTCIASSFECLHTYTTHTILKFCIFVQNRILIRFLHISCRLGKSTSCWM